MTDRYAVIGDPIAHSLSPAMQSAAFQAAGLDAGYEAIHVAPAALPEAVARLRAEDYRGFNVTVPHKEAILPLLDRLDTVAEAVGAVNTVVREGDALVGYNTDVEGFVEAVVPLTPSPSPSRGERSHACRERSPLPTPSLLRPRPRPLRERGPGGEGILLGSGGSAHAVAHALLHLGYHLTIVNRTLENAHRLAETLPAPSRVLSPDDSTLPRLIQGAAIMVNTTPLGMAHLPTLSPIPEGIPLNPQTLMVDLVYGRATPFLARAAVAGCRTMDGLEMLVQQGAASFRLWTGAEPDVTVMRAACRRALEDKFRCSAS